MSPWRLKQISRQLLHGAVIAYPTDTIWGLGCHPGIEQAVSRVNTVKNRPRQKSLILLSSDPNFFHGYLEDPMIDRLINADSGERPTTWIVPASPYCPSWLASSNGTLAVRVSKRPPIKALCDPIGSPIISTSANLSGTPPVRNSIQAHARFHHRIDYIIEGFKSGSQKASQIKNLITGQVLRA